ncbi:hypothetical protein [Roseibium sp.]|uniref:hypothetical protein n=1 Tax=Roseibium sp. TaxID=1936156 RepID=UPI003D144EB9
MADYYSILKKTIASLPESNGAARRSVYSRARNAIVNQLKAYEPPLSPSEITAEQLRLEEAIRKVEAEAARETLGLGPAAPRVQTPAPQPAAQPASTPEPAAASVDPADAPAPTDETPQAAPEEDIPSPLKDTLSEAEALGSAANQAVQNVKDAVEPAGEQAPLDKSAQRQEPSFDQSVPEDDGLFEPEDEAADHAGASRLDESAEQTSNRRAKAGRTRRERPSASDALRGEGSSGSRILPIALAAVLVLALVAIGAYLILPSGDQVASDAPLAQSDPVQADIGASSTEDVALSAPEDDEEQAKNTDRLLSDEDGEVVAPDARTVTTTTITPQPSEPAPAPAQPSIVTSVESEPAPVPAQPAAPDALEADAEQPQPVSEDNLAAVAPVESAPAAPATGTATAAQRSILYEEGADAGGAGTAAQGAVVWNIEKVTNLDGKSQSVLSASVDIPERDVKVDIRIKPNDDTSLPASHLVEIKYEFPEDFAAGDVVNVPGLVMKPTEEARGDALIGASVKVQPGFFWIALSSLPNEQQRNMALLRERGWIDIPMLYENGKRGILTLEKGPTGEEAVEQAITSWQAG